MQVGTLDLKTVKKMVEAQELMVKGNAYRPGVGQAVRYFGLWSVQ